ncbi:MAG: hypothetical protein WD766_03405 [Gemmatimonadota bacterium]
MRSTSRLVPIAGLLATVALTLPTASPAQSSGDGFLFEPPSVVLNLHGGYSRPDAGSEFFSFVTDLLTLGKRDFHGLAVGGTLSVPLSSRLDASVSSTYSGRVSDSEFRDWIGGDDLPIEQSTRFERVPVTASAKLHLRPRGRSVGSLAWVPNRYAPYLGAGGGAVWYRFVQQGEFVDFEDESVFADELDSSGWAPAAQAFAGVEFSLSPRIAVTTEASYLWASTKLQGDFIDFDRIDLSGFSATAGLSLRL